MALRFLYYREQEAGKGEGDGGKTTAILPCSGQAHDQCPSSGDLVAQSYSKPDADSSSTYGTSESREKKQRVYGSIKAQSTMNNESAIDRKRAALSLRYKQTTFDWCTLLNLSGTDISSGTDLLKDTDIPTGTEFT